MRSSSWGGGFVCAHQTPLPDIFSYLSSSPQSTQPVRAPSTVPKESLVPFICGSNEAPGSPGMQTLVLAVCWWMPANYLALPVRVRPLWERWGPTGECALLSCNARSSLRRPLVMNNDVCAFDTGKPVVWWFMDWWYGTWISLTCSHISAQFYSMTQSPITKKITPHATFGD